MGAAGLTSTSCEMASRGHVGIDMELDRVPQRETGMTPYEMMLSESQERMLLVAERGREQEVFAVFRKWGLDAVEIGRVTSTGLLRVLHHGQLAAEIPAQDLAHEAPVYDRPAAAPPAAARQQSEARVSLAAPGGDLTKNFLRLLAAPNIASKRWVFEQYDHMVRTNTLAVPGAADAAVIRLKGTKRALALSTTAVTDTLVHARSARGSDARRGRSPRATWPPPARAPGPPPTASTSAIPKSPKSCGNFSRPSTASPKPAAR